MIKIILIVCLFGTCFGSWPCPLEIDIDPCICTNTANYELNLDCSLVQDDIQLQTALTAMYPFFNFNELKIIQNKDASPGLNTLSPSTFGDISFVDITITGTSLEKVVEQSLFNSHDTLIQLHLHGNEITDFEIEAISSFKFLANLNLKNNHLTSLPTLTSESLVSFSAAHNTQLKIYGDTFAEAPNLLYIDLNDISLQDIPDNLFANLTEPYEIDLSHNLLTHLREDAIKPLSPSIHILDFTENMIEDIYHDALHSSLAKNADLILTGNEMVTLEKINALEPIFSTLAGNGVIHLNGNPLICGCDVKWIVNNQAYWDTVSPDTLCDNDGKQYFQDLDKNYINSNCP